MGSMGPIDPPEMEKEKGQKASEGQARAQPTSGVEIWLGITRKLAREGEREALAVPREVHTSFDVRRPSKEDPGRRDFGGEKRSKVSIDLFFYLGLLFRRRAQLYLLYIYINRKLRQSSLIGPKGNGENGACWLDKRPPQQKQKQYSSSLRPSRGSD